MLIGAAFGKAVSHLRFNDNSRSGAFEDVSKDIQSFTTGVVL